MNVLSLFDGMSCGMIALDRIGLHVENYFASEIDEPAIKVSKHNWKDVQHVGDVTKLQAKDLPKIDLLIGGSPCQSFSIAGDGSGFDGKSGLFFEYVRLLEETKPTYFMLENVLMKKEWENKITEILGVEPVFINSSLVSAQDRKRLYWTNIPGLTQPYNRGLRYRDILGDDVEENHIIDRDKYPPNLRTPRSFNSDKPVRIGGYKKEGQGQRIYSINAKAICQSALGGGWGAKGGLYMVDGIVRKPTRSEIEALQTVDAGYTDCVPYRDAAQMLGNGWTVDVIAHIFQPLRAIYEIKKAI